MLAAVRTIAFPATRLFHVNGSMKTKQLNLAISESLWQDLEFLAKATDQSLESLAVNCILHQLPQVRQQVRELDEFLEKVNPENIHGEIGLKEIAVSYVP